MTTDLEKGSILVVDDTDDVRSLLRMQLEFQGHQVHEARNGRQAMELLRQQPFDLMLLDIMMPEMNGYEVLEQMRNEPGLQRLPVVVISAVQDLESVVRCIELGAADYLPKPFKTTLLRARVGALLEQKRLRDREQAYLRMIEEERSKSEQLLLNILPAPIAERLKAGETIIADSCPDASVLFADLVGFTDFAGRVSAAEVVNTLNGIFMVFDELVEKYGLEKVKTTGDAYMVVGGLNMPRLDHAEAMADLALAMCDSASDFHQTDQAPISIRIGMHTGPIVAGVIGKKKFIYDLWGDTVNVASRMEAQGLPGAIQVADSTYRRLNGGFTFRERGRMDIKGKGEMQTYMLLSRK